MCTVSYIPTGNGHFILSSNRDEQVRRKEASLKKINWKGAEVLCPVDGMAGGSWIAADSRGRVSVLLNGAFKAHKKKAAYRESRGVIFLNQFLHPTFKDFIQLTNLDDIEPFMILALEPEMNLVTELRWDGKQKFVKIHDPNKALLYSSVTLYDEEITMLRKRKFEYFIENFKIEAPQITAFHLDRILELPEPKILLSRPDGIQTVSFSRIEYGDSGISFDYKDLIQEENSKVLSLNFLQKMEYNG